MIEFVKQLGSIQSLNNVWKVIFFANFCPYIKFKNIKGGTLISYYDMDIIERRYVDLTIDKWLLSHD